MARGYEITRVWGIPIKLHISMLIVPPYFMGMGLPFHIALLAIVVVYTSVALHELGHSAAARRYGYGVREILLVPIGGVAMLAQNPRKPIEEFVIAIAGPLVSLGLAFISFILYALGSAVGFASLSLVFIIALQINLMLCIFNLIPSFPMDGGRVFRACMTPKVGRLRATYLAARIGKAIAIAFGLFAMFYGEFDFMLLMIAVFIYYAAGAEYRALLVRDQFKQFSFSGGGSEPPSKEQEGNFHAGPAPYAANKQARGPNAFQRWVNGMYEEYDS